MLLRNPIYRIVLSAFLLVVASVPARAQETRHKDSDWSESEAGAQEARLRYFEEWERSGPEQDLVAGRKRAFEQMRSMNNSVAMKVQSSGAWKPIGGSQDLAVSGRATGIAFDPTNPSVAYLTTAQGGAFKTTNKGETWVGLSDSWATLAAGGIAVDPTRPNIIYAGTGDANSPATGIGIYRSEDGGLNWSLVVDASKVDAYTLGMLIDPVNPDIVYHIGGSKISRSTDRGETWATWLANGDALAIDPTNTQHMVAAVGSSVKRTTDGGLHWTSATGLSSGLLVNIAMSTSDPNTVYASVGTGGDISTVGLARSTDGGATFKMTNKSVNYLGSQAFYANAIAVSPKNPEEVIVGGLDIYRSRNGGTNLTQLSYWTKSSSAGDFTHADVHVLAYNPYDNAALWTLTDGGVYRSVNSGSTWTQSINITLSTLQFVGADANRQFTYAIGGTQDNGTNKAGINQTFFRQVNGGDGGYAFVSQNDTGEVVYTTHFGPSLEKSTDGGEHWVGGDGPNGNIVANQQLLNEGSQFYMRYGICEIAPEIVLICGNSKLYRSLVGGSDGFTLCPGPINGPKTVHLPSADPFMMYCATGSVVYMSTDQGDTWRKSKTTTSGISWMVSDRNDPGKVYAVSGGFGGTHFWVSTDSANTWKKPTTNMPDENYTSLALAPDGTLFAGHDLGVVFSTDGGTTWTPLMSGLPLAQIKTLQVRGTGPDYYLLAASYGRGLWYFPLNELPSGTHAVGSRPQIAETSKLESVYPNPVVGSSRELNVKFSVPSSAPAKMSIFDELGREQQVMLNEWVGAGSQTRSFSMPEMAAGRYYVVLVTPGHTESMPIVVQK